MKPETWTALRQALISADPDRHDINDAENNRAKFEWHKFGSVEPIITQLEAGAISDPDLLIVAATALRELSEKTERVAQGRKALYQRDGDFNLTIGNIVKGRAPDGRLLPDPRFKATDAVDRLAAKYGFSDPRGVWKAIKKYLSHSGNDRSKY